MSKEKIEMKTNGTYTFTSNAAWHWKEQFRREPRMAAAVIPLLHHLVAAVRPMADAEAEAGVAEEMVGVEEEEMEELLRRPR